MVAPVSEYPQRHVVKVTWPTITTTGANTSVDISRWNDMTVQAIGTFGAGGTVLIQGSQSTATGWNTLNDPQGTALSLTDNTPYAVLENMTYIRPQATTVSGTTDIDVILTGTTR